MYNNTNANSVNLLNRLSMISTDRKITLQILIVITRANHCNSQWRPKNYPYGKIQQWVKRYVKNCPNVNCLWKFMKASSTSHSCLCQRGAWCEPLGTHQHAVRIMIALATQPKQYVEPHPSWNYILYSNLYPAYRPSLVLRQCLRLALYLIDIEFRRLEASWQCLHVTNDELLIMPKDSQTLSQIT